MLLLFFFFQAEDGIRDTSVTGVQTCALPISFCQTRTPLTLTQLSDCVSVISSCTWQSGTSMTRLRASAIGPVPSASLFARRATRIMPGTALNLFVGNNPGSVVD